LRKLPQESMDHGLLSPSGRVSKRARNAALKRENERMWGPGGIDAYLREAREEHLKAIQPTKKEALLQQAARLREFAGYGCNTRKYNREAERLEREAAKLPE